MEVLLEGRAEAAAELYCSAPTSLSLRSGQPCTAVSVATAAWLLGQDAAEMAERTLQCVCVCVCVCVRARVCFGMLPTETACKITTVVTWQHGVGAVKQR